MGGSDAGEKFDCLALAIKIASRDPLWPPLI
jgi:hypothetical protein